MSAKLDPVLGCYIALEGQEGCGKSTQATRLAAALDAVLTREPGGTPFGQEIRSVLLHGTERIDERAEVLLFAADRAQHLRDVVVPALRTGRHVVSDRSLWSSVAYQGSARGVGVDDVININRWATNGVFPDVVVLLDASYETLRDRMQGRQLDRIEREGQEFFDMVRSSLLDLAARHRWLVVDASLDIERQTQLIVDGIRDRIEPVLIGGRS